MIARHDRVGIETPKTLAERAQWYREGCPHLEDLDEYLRNGLAADAADDLGAALKLLAAAGEENARLREALKGFVDGECRCDASIGKCVQCVAAAALSSSQVTTK